MKKLTLLTIMLTAMSLAPFAKALDAAPVAPQGGITDVFDYINDFRAENGLERLNWNDQLGDITETHSTKMHDSSNLNHYIQGKGPEERLDEAGIKWSCYVENIGYNKGQPDKAKAVFESWKKSDAHRKNMLDSCITEGAIGWRGCEIMGHYFTFMAIKPAGVSIQKMDAVKIEIRQGEMVSAKITITNPNDKRITVNSSVTIKPVGIRFGVGPATLDIEPGMKGEFTISVGAENATAGVFDGEIEFSYDGGKLVYPVTVTVKEKPVSKKIVVMWVGKSEYTVNGKQFTTQIPPTIYKNSTVVGVRMISDIFGAKTDYDGATKTVKITNKGIEITMQVGNPNAKVAGVTVPVKPPPVLISSRVYVPLRFIVETLGGTVSYEAKTKKITITIE